jgi:carbamoyltransferase
MITWGINALNHGSSLAVFQGNQLIRFETCKTDELDKEILFKALNFGGPSIIYWYERPYLKKFRQLYAGQFDAAFNLNNTPRHYLDNNNLRYAKLKYTPHHGSHAAAGYYTSPFDHCAVIVLDAIGEFECATIWECKNNRMNKIWSRTYPNSLGLFYSAFTKLIGYEPIVGEYRLQQDSLLGDYRRYYHKVESYFSGIVSLRYNFHRGVRDWTDPINNDQDRYDIAAAVQRVFEDQIGMVMNTAKKLVSTNNLVYMGGCAMNSAANQKVVEPMFDRIWSLPSPGDFSSAAGAVLYHTQQRINWQYGVAKHISIKV